MDKRSTVIYLFILFIFFASIDIWDRNSDQTPWEQIQTETPIDVTCYQTSIPPGADVLFFTEIDGTYQYAYPIIQSYYFTQYEIAPRVLHGFTETAVDRKQYEWFIGYQLTPEIEKNFALQNNVKIIASCGDGIVFRQIP